MSLDYRKLSKRASLVLLLAGLAVGVGFYGQAADHRDGPIFVNTAANGRGDINDVYVFKSPANASNTVLAMTMSPFAGNLTPSTFDQRISFELKVANNFTNNDFVEKITFRVNFGPPDATGAQDVTLRVLPAGGFPNGGLLAHGKTNTDILVAGGGTFRAGNFDDPFFFDAKALSDFLAAGTASYPRPVGQAKNFFANANTLGFVLEVPSTVLTRAGSDIIGVWGATTANGIQLDRNGRPGINTVLIPPIPRNNASRGERRNAFNAGIPANDRRDFTADMSSILSGFFGKDAATASVFAGLLLPDMLVFQIGNPSGYGNFVGSGSSFLGNGRRLTDPVIHTSLALLTGGAITTDNVDDDNGLKITDGSVDPVSGQTRAIAFPYMGTPNSPPGGPNP